MNLPPFISKISIIVGLQIILLLTAVTLNSTSAKVEPTISGTYESKAFEITNMSAIYNPESVYNPTYEIVGIVHNISNKSFESIGLSVELYDKNNTLIGVENGSPNVPNLPPGDHSPFKITTSESPKNSDLNRFHITVAASEIESGENQTDFSI